MGRWHYWLITLGLVAVVALPALSYQLGAYRGWLGAEVSLGPDRVSDLEQTNRSLKTRYDAAWSGLQSARRKLQVGNEENAQLAGKLEESDRAANALRDELAFYRQIVSGNSADGVHIYGWTLHRQPPGNRFGYKLVLLRGGEGDREVTGKVQVAVEGLRAGHKVVVALDAMGAHLESVKFKHLQVFKGVFSVPSEFQPIRVRVRVLQSRRKAKPVEVWFDWSLS